MISLKTEPNELRVLGKHSGAGARGRVVRKLFKESLTPQEIKKLKTVAAELLDCVKRKIAEFDHWQDKDETRSAVELVIRDILWEKLPESFDENSINDCRERVYEYVYSRYPAVAV